MLLLEEFDSKALECWYSENSRWRACPPLAAVDFSSVDLRERADALACAFDPLGVAHLMPESSPNSHHFTSILPLLHGRRDLEVTGPARSRQA